MCEVIGVAMVTNMISQLQGSFPLRSTADSSEISFTKFGNFTSIYKINGTSQGRFSLTRERCFQLMKIQFVSQRA